MKTSVIEVRDMLPVLSVLGLEKRIGEVPGVESVTVNCVGGSAPVRYDETRLNVAVIKSDERQGEYEPAAALAGDSHEGHTAPGTPPAAPGLATRRLAPDTVASPESAGSAPEGHTPPGARLPTPAIAEAAT